MDLSIATVGTPITYTYDTNWTDKLISYGGESIVYDAIGNPTSYRGATLTWNGRLLTSYEKGEDRFEYTYDENGLRTSKKHYDNGVLNTTYHYLWQNSKLYGTKATIASSGASVVFNYLYSGNEIVGVYVNDSVLMYIKNLQGDIVSVVNTENNEIVLKYYYDAWGNISYEASESNIGELMAILVLATTNFSYRGYFCDYETGLYYLQSRYYDPEVGRFINLDDTEIITISFGDCFDANLSVYCRNNPINYVDYWGYQPKFFSKISSFIKKSLPFQWFTKATQANSIPMFFDIADFFMDENGIYHTRVDCWQKWGGYNDLYDGVFNLATDMQKRKFEFNYLHQNYIFWAWKGDYLNLGAGGEVGIYKSLFRWGTKIWQVDLSLAMKMILYVFYKKDYRTINEFTEANILFSYAPSEKQWWITGFNPKYQNIKAKDLYLMCFIFFDDPEMYYAFKEDNFGKPELYFWDEHYIIKIAF